jgi:hypothetical protein
MAATRFAELLVATDQAGLLILFFSFPVSKRRGGKGNWLLVGDSAGGGGG